MQMSKSIDRLAEMVRQAEAKTRAQKLGSETHLAADVLKAADTKAREAETRLRERRVVLQRTLAEVAEDEQKLKDLTRKVAILMGTASLTPEDSQVFTSQIEETKQDIEARRKEAQLDIDNLNREVLQTRSALEAAMGHYVALRKELDRLLPQLSDEFGDADRLARSAEVLTPGGQVRALAREVEDASPHFGVLDPRERLAQLTIWIGRFRRLQAYEASHITEEETAALQRVFPRLVGISKQYEPGYIEAFRQSFNTDWDDYVTEAEEQLKQATETARLRRDTDQRRRAQVARTEDRQRQARSDADEAFDDLKAILIRYHLPEDEEGLEPFYEALDRVIAGRGASDTEVLELVAPYRDLLTGAEYRAIRKHLDRLKHEEERETPSLPEEVRDILERTRGKRALMIGGAAREDMRRTLEHVFEFDSLDWESHEGNRPALLESLEQRVRNHGVDLVIVIKTLVGHNVTDRLRPACEQSEIPFILVDKGYGPSQVAEGLKRVLMRTA
jgi:hypothetical protein